MMKRRSAGRRGDASREDQFEHASRHVDLDALLAEHLGGTRAAESVVQGRETRRSARGPEASPQPASQPHALWLRESALLDDFSRPGDSSDS
jgi:hypothetical protein